MSKLKSFEFNNSSKGIIATRIESDDDINEMKELMDKFDQLHPKGRYVVPNVKSPRIKIRELDKYCKEKGILPTDLTEKEMKQFRY